MRHFFGFIYGGTKHCDKLPRASIVHLYLVADDFTATIARRVKGLHDDVQALLVGLRVVVLWRLGRLVGLLGEDEGVNARVCYTFSVPSRELETEEAARLRGIKSDIVLR